MSKIKDVCVIDSSVSIILESGVFLKDYYEDSVITFFYSVVDDIVGVEIFDQVRLDDIIRKYDNLDSVFFVSCIFLRLGAMDMGVSISKYIGDYNFIPSILYFDSIDDDLEKVSFYDDINREFIVHNKNDNYIFFDNIKYLFVDLENFLTITDFINYFFSLKDKNIILFSKNNIVYDLASGLGIPYIFIKKSDF